MPFAEDTRPEHMKMISIVIEASDDNVGIGGRSTSRAADASSRYDRDVGPHKRASCAQSLLQTSLLSRWRCACLLRMVYVFCVSAGDRVYLQRSWSGTEASAYWASNDQTAEMSRRS